MGDFVAYVVFDLIFEMGTYYTAKLILPVLSFGRLRVEPFFAEQEQAAAPQRQTGARFVVIRKETAQLIGLATWIVALPTTIILWRWLSMP